MVQFGSAKKLPGPWEGACHPRRERPPRRYVREPRNMENIPHWRAGPRNASGPHDSRGPATQTQQNRLRRSTLGKGNDGRQKSRPRVPQGDARVHGGTYPTCPGASRTARTPEREAVRGPGGGDSLRLARVLIADGPHLTPAVKLRAEVLVPLTGRTRATEPRPTSGAHASPRSFGKREDSGAASFAAASTCGYRHRLEKERVEQPPTPAPGADGGAHLPETAHRGRANPHGRANG